MCSCALALVFILLNFPKMYTPPPPIPQPDLLTSTVEPAAAALNLHLFCTKFASSHFGAAADTASAGATGIPGSFAAKGAAKSGARARIYYACLHCVCLQTSVRASTFVFRSNLRFVELNSTATNKLRRCVCVLLHCFVETRRCAFAV